MLVCSVSGEIKKKIALISNLVDVPGKQYSKFSSEVVLDGNKPIFRGVHLSDRSGLRTTRQTRLDEYHVANIRDAESDTDYSYSDTFRLLINNTVSYLNKRFQPFEEEPLVWFKVFDTEKWPLDLNSLKSIGNHEIAKFLDYYYDREYITCDEKTNAISEWELLKIEAFQRKQLNNNSGSYEIYTSILKTPSLKEEIMNILVLLELMMTISVSTASCERGFSHMNNEKTSLRTGMRSDTLDDVMRINVDRTSVAEFDPLPVFKLWIKQGPKHVNSHKLKEKMSSTDLATSLLRISSEESNNI